MISPSYGTIKRMLCVGDNIIAAASTGDSAFVTLSTDRGSTWNYQPEDLPLNFSVQNFGLGKYGIYAVGTIVHSNLRVFQSTNGGRSWINRSSGLPSISDCNAVAFLNDTVFVGTGDLDGNGAGVFASTDQGTTWFDISYRLPYRCKIDALSVHRGYLFAAAYSGWFVGSGVWRRPLSEVVLGINMVSFTGMPLNDHTARLDWVTLGEENNSGFTVQRRRLRDTMFTQIPNSFISGHGTTNQRHEYRFTDSTASAGSWDYRLTYTVAGTTHFTEPIQVNLSPDGVNDGQTYSFALEQNYPNPFNPSTHIKFTLPAASHVSLAVYDMLGRKVAVLVNGQVAKGYNSATWNASGVASGVFFAQFTATDANGNVRLAKVSKLLLTK
ncbi:MAG: T9SS type A sorting domain-containing protein [Ignavibacteriae bacterium]|nr:T9SS type A sorting domain-containing protein [Ignavibacteriota bacterium]